MQGDKSCVKVKDIHTAIDIITCTCCRLSSSNIGVYNLNLPRMSERVYGSNNPKFLDGQIWAISVEGAV